MLQSTKFLSKLLGIGDEFPSLAEKFGLAARLSDHASQSDLATRDQGGIGQSLSELF